MEIDPKDTGICPWCGMEALFYRYGKQRCPECLRPIVVSEDDPGDEVEITHSLIRRVTANDKHLKKSFLSQISFWEGIVWEFFQMSDYINSDRLEFRKEIERVKRRIERLKEYAGIEEGRRSRRIPASVKVRYGLNEPSHEGCVYNLSEGGVSMRDGMIFSAGSTVKLDFHLKGEVCKAEGIIVWAGDTQSDTRMPGMGIRLLNTGEEIKRFYYNSLSQLS